MYRLPKAIESDPQATLLLTTLATAPHRLWPESPVRIPEADLNAALLEALLAAHRAGRVVRSLEKAQIVLTRMANERLTGGVESCAARGYPVYWC